MLVKQNAPNSRNFSISSKTLKKQTAGVICSKLSLFLDASSYHQIALE